MENPDLLEFDKLKDEQIGRLAYRDNLFYLSMGIIGAIVATYFAYAGARMVLLWLPWAMFIVGVAHLTCERRIQDIGLYIRKHLAPNLAAQTGRKADDFFAWETFFRKSRWHPWRKRLHLFSSVLLYVFSGVAAVTFYVLSHDKAKVLETGEKLFIVADIAVIIVTFALFVVFARFSPDSEITGTPEQKPRRLKRAALAALLAVIAGAATYFGAAFLGLPAILAEWCAAAGVAPPTPWQVTVGATIVTWSVALLTGRR